jgi:hypothetical protein
MRCSVGVPVGFPLDQLSVRGGILIGHLEKAASPEAVPCCTFQTVSTVGIMPST